MKDTTMGNIILLVIMFCTIILTCDVFVRPYFNKQETRVEFVARVAPEIYEEGTVQPLRIGKTYKTSGVASSTDAYIPVPLRISPTYNQTGQYEPPAGWTHKEWEERKEIQESIGKDTHLLINAVDIPRTLLIDAQIDGVSILSVSEANVLYGDEGREIGKVTDKDIVNILRFINRY